MMAQECSTLSLRTKFIWLPSMASSTRKRLSQKQNQDIFWHQFFFITTAIINRKSQHSKKLG
ncbi:hypothetical protein BIU88_10190 [Chlorobaculum limnaeum]|uniref:Uncharacterized protein n=1 Tax=Chlorobaculum limnaeum TaxID=274537 RepID=A0A1D8D8D3_CHLLM|nr:hypothetical protein BIU88_10190 [Chlorobaculum limnaeum]